MKFGFRKPSLKKSIKARTTGRLKRRVKSSINPTYGKKGMGVIKNPKKAVYNKVYNKTSFSIWDIFKSKNKVQQKKPSKEFHLESIANHIDNQNRILQESINLMNSTRNPETFFRRFDLVLSTLDKAIKIIEEYESLQFDGEHPADAKKRVLESRSEYVNDFINRYYQLMHEKITSLKTDKGKLNNISKFRLTLLEDYSHHLSSQNIELINKLYNETLEEFNL